MNAQQILKEFCILLKQERELVGEELAHLKRRVRGNPGLASEIMESDLRNDGNASLTYMAGHFAGRLRGLEFVVEALDKLTAPGAQVCNDPLDEQVRCCLPSGHRGAHEAPNPVPNAMRVVSGPTVKWTRIKTGLEKI